MFVPRYFSHAAKRNAFAQLPATGNKLQAGGVTFV
jgi:hypothetical protein